MRALNSASRCLILAGLLFMAVGVSVPKLGRKSSLAFAQPGYRDREGLNTQQLSSEPGSSHLSEPYRSAWCPAAVRLSQHVPTWAHGFLAQFTGEDLPLDDVVVYDRQGKQFSAAHIRIPNLTEISLLAVAPTMQGGAIVSGSAMTNPGSTFFLAKTSVSGGVVSVLQTEAFAAGRICEASDNTIWTLGIDPQKEHARDDNYPLVRQYSFERRLLHTYLSKIVAGLGSTTMYGAGGNPSGSFLVCGKERISLYIGRPSEYIEIDPSTETLKLWKMTTKPLAEGVVGGLAVTEKGRAFASLFEDKQSETGRTLTRGLFELRINRNAETGSWILVGGTLISYRPEDSPKGTLGKLWGADGEDLVIRHLNEADLSWVHVLP